MPVKGISGTAVFAVAAGGVLMYSGFKGKGVASAFRYVLMGENPNLAVPANPITGMVATANAPVGSVGGIQGPSGPGVHAWAVAQLAAIAAPPTGANIQSLVNWQAREGGNWENTAHFNPLNTTQRMPGSTAMNSVGVQSYTDWASGIAATSITLENGRYGDILSALRSGVGLSGNYFSGLLTWSGGAYSSV